MEDDIMDRRVLKTKRAIRNAFAKLLTEKDLNDITVKDVAELADINRKTFYNYYTGIYQLVDEIENDIAEEFASNIDDLDVMECLRDPMILFNKLAEMMKKDYDFYSSLFKINVSSVLLKKIAGSMIEIAKNVARKSIKDADEDVLDITVKFIFYGEVLTFHEWFSRGGRDYPVELMRETIGGICTKGVGGMISERRQHGQ